MAENIGWGASMRTRTNVINELVDEFNAFVGEVRIIPFISGTQISSTAEWTGVAATLTALEDKQTIHYWLPYESGGNATLNITLADGTTTGAINCYYAGATPLSTQFPAGSMITLTYRKDVKIGSGETTYTGWWVNGASNGGGGIENVIVDVLSMITTQDIATFKNLTNRYRNGEIVITAKAGDITGIVTGVGYYSDTDMDWTVSVPTTSFTHVAGVTTIDTASMTVFVLDYNGATLSLATRDFPLESQFYVGDDGYIYQKE